MPRTNASWLSATLAELRLPADAGLRDCQTPSPIVTGEGVFRCRLVSTRLRGRDAFADGGWGVGWGRHGDLDLWSAEGGTRSENLGNLNGIQRFFFEQSLNQLLQLALILPNQLV